MTRPLYVTTPIYYVNDRPHLGTAYTTVAADVMGRYARLRGREVRLLTGTDEHGQKIERKARERGLHPQAFADEVAPAFEAAWRALDIEYDDFLRTTEPRHVARAQELWRRCVESGDVYLGAYEGWYCVADEAFYLDKDLVDGLSPTGRPVERVKEPSYFFRLSGYQGALLEHYAKHPNFVVPAGRFNEVRRFVEDGLEDLSISRTSFSWGVPVPDDPAHVLYVWFDALASYLSGGSWAPSAEVLHVVGKDILRFHAVYWPAFLLSAGLPLPTTILAHGWLTIRGHKLSKSDGNPPRPEPVVRELGSDVLRFYLCRDVALGKDGDFSPTALLARQRDLANGVGNLLQRFVKTIVPRSTGGLVPEKRLAQPIDEGLARLAEETARSVALEYERFAPHRALDVAWGLVTAANRYVDETAPWVLEKDPASRDRLDAVVYTALEALRFLSLLLAPVLPRKCRELRAQLGLGDAFGTPGADVWPKVFGELVPGTRLVPGPPLFPRIDATEAERILERLTAAGELD